MVKVRFSIQNKKNKIRFFEKAFLLANTSMKVVLWMSFLAFSNADIQFLTESFTWRSYSTAKALSTARWAEYINKHKFAKAALYKNSETFVVHVAVLKALKPFVHLFRAPRPTALQQDKAHIKIPLEYSDYTDIFSPDLAMDLPENTRINEHAIELVKDKQPPYDPIYTLRSVELEMLKTNRETHLKTRFIWPSKSPVGILILFDKKHDGSQRLCVDWRSFHNLTIKNHYPLPLIGMSLDRLGRAKLFI